MHDDSTYLTMGTVGGATCVPRESEVEGYDFWTFRVSVCERLEVCLCPERAQCRDNLYHHHGQVYGPDRGLETLRLV